MIRLGCVSMCGSDDPEALWRNLVDAGHGPSLILLCGLPGSGKTTLAKRLADAIPAVRLCPDEWMADLGIDLFDAQTRDRLERRFSQHAQELLKLGQSVILEFGFWSRSERDEKRLGARALGVPVELHYLAAPIDELCRRLEARYAEGASGTARITREMLEPYAELFEAPTTDELSLFDEPPWGGGGDRARPIPGAASGGAPEGLGRAGFIRRA